MSRIAAPSGEVTTPMMRGHLGKGRFRSTAKSPSRLRDFLKAAEKVFGPAWQHESYMITRPVTLKAMLRVCADLSYENADPAEGRQDRWERRLRPWGDHVRAFRAEGFYERFPAKGQVRVVVKVFGRLSPVDVEYWHVEKT